MITKEELAWIPQAGSDFVENLAVFLDTFVNTQLSSANGFSSRLQTSTTSMLTYAKQKQTRKQDYEEFLLLPPTKDQLWCFSLVYKVTNVQASFTGREQKCSFNATNKDPSFLSGQQPQTRPTDGRTDTWLWRSWHLDATERASFTVHLFLC